MVLSLYGIKTVAKDGFEYESRFEAEFVNKFLIPHNITYERQKQYSEKTKHRCDFYLPDYDVWTECVYSEYVPKKAYLLGKEDITFSIPYSDGSARAYAKAFGARWDKSNKHWVLNRNLIDSTEFPKRLEKYMKAELLEYVYDTDQTNLTENYNANFQTKLELYSGLYTIIQVNYTDLRQNHVADLIRIKNNSLFHTLLKEKPHLIPTKPVEVIQSTEPKIEETLVEVEKKVTTNGAVVHADGTVTYPNKKNSIIVRKDVEQQKRQKQFNMILNSSTTDELEDFVVRLKERISKHKSKRVS